MNGLVPDIRRFINACNNNNNNNNNNNILGEAWRFPALSVPGQWRWSTEAGTSPSSADGEDPSEAHGVPWPSGDGCEGVWLQNMYVSTIWVIQTQSALYLPDK